MSLFSPIADRSGRVRCLYGAVYLLLALGAVTMLVPLLVTVTGSMSGPNDKKIIALYPDFLFSDDALWSRYVDARYGGEIDSLRMAWGDPDADFFDIVPPRTPPDGAKLALWREFLAERGGPLEPLLAGLAFTRPNRQNAALENTRFRDWLVQTCGGTLEKLNETLGLELGKLTWLVPPIQNRIVFAGLRTPLAEAFDEYLLQVPPGHRMPWDVGGFYRAVFLPRLFGGRIAGYNEQFGTDYLSFTEVPFPAAPPETGWEPWLRFVGVVLNPDFVELTPEGQAALEAGGKGKGDFLRGLTSPEFVRVRSLDREFAAWAAKRGMDDARIPQRDLDWLFFLAEKTFWRMEFVTQNFRFVLEEVVIQGNGVRNTFILVVLSVAGALTVNPMAAYALSRFKLKQSYSILLFFLATIAFPAEVAMIPGFLQVKELGMINTFWALVIPGLVNGFSIFLLKGFFDSLPRELYEAADIDGAGEWQIFWGITMNLSKPILAVIALGAFTGAYGAFMFALILAPDQSMWTLMVWIYQLQQSAGPGIVYASVLLTAVPTLLVYLFTQNLIMRGIIVPTDK